MFKPDEIEGGGWYGHVNQTTENSWNRNYLDAPVNATGRVYLRSNFYGDTWIFHEKLVVRVGETRLESGVIPGYSDQNHRTNSGGSVWETLHFTLVSDGGIMDAIAAAPEATVRVRFQGDENYHDIVLSSRDKRAIAESVEFGNVLRRLRENK